MKNGDCVHFRGVQRICARGENPRDYRQVLTREEKQACGARVGVGLPCLASFPPGYYCTGLTPATPEDVARDQQEIERILKAADAGQCPTCGSSLTRKGNWFVCGEHGGVVHVHE